MRDGGRARRIECRPDDGRHFRDLILNGFQPVDRGGVWRRRLDQQLNMGGDQIQRGSDLMGHVCRRLSQRRQAARPSELFAQHGHLTMTVGDFHALLSEHLGGGLDAHVHRGVQAVEPLEDVVQSPGDDADFVQTVDRHAGVQSAGGGGLHRLTQGRESSVHQQACRLIHQQRHEQDGAQREPERRLTLTRPDAEIEPPQRADHQGDNGGDDEAESDSERECGHGEARAERQAPDDSRNAGASTRRGRSERRRREARKRPPCPRRRRTGSPWSPPDVASCLTAWRSCRTVWLRVLTNGARIEALRHVPDGNQSCNFGRRTVNHFDRGSLTIEHASGRCPDASRERRGSDAGYDSLDAVD